MTRILNVERRIERLEDELEDHYPEDLIEVRYYLEGYCDFTAKYTPAAYERLMADLERSYGNG